MKKMKYSFLIGALMLSLSAPVFAQDGTKADVDAVKQLVSQKPADLQKQLKKYVSKNSKNPENLTEFARVFYQAGDLASAKTLATQAVSANKKAKYAPAYALLGDIAVKEDDGGGAALFFEQAIAADPTLAEPYLKYATIYSKTNFELSVDKLNQLKQAVPDYPVELPIADLYRKAGKVENAIEYYSKVDRTKMVPVDFANFALMHHLMKDYDKSQSLVEEGLKRFPRNASLNRLGLMNTIAKEQFSVALDYADRLFNRSDSADLKDLDYNNYAKAYIGNGQFDEGIAMYRKTIEVSKSEGDAVNNIYKEISEAYQKKGDWDQAAVEYQQYLANTSSKTFNDYRGLAELYYKNAADLTGEEQMAKIKMADDVYADVQKRFANNADVLAFVLNRRGTLNAIMDPNSEKGLAKPIFEELMTMLEAKPSLEQIDKNRLVTCYRYMMSYALLNLEDNAQAREWAQKILTIDPENAQAQQVIESIK